MAQQVLDCDVLADQRQIGSEHRARRGRQLEQPVLDHADDGECRQPLGGTGGGELGGGRVRDAVAAVRQSVRLLQLDAPGPVDAHHTREPRAPRDIVKPTLEPLHPLTLPASVRYSPA